MYRGAQLAARGYQDYVKIKPGSEMTIFHGVTAFLFVVALPVFGLQDAVPHTDRRITLNLVVTDKTGKAQSGLQQGDFTVVDNKLPQKIVSFQAVVGNATPAPPVEIILVVDRVNSSFAGAANERQQTEKFLRQNGGFPVHKPDSS